MPKTYKGPSSLVLASVKPGGSMNPSLRAAVQLCKRTGMRLRLVSAIEASQVKNLRYAPKEMFDFTAISRSESAELKAQVEDDLRSIANNLELEQRVEISVVIGKPAQVILSDAVVNGATMIVTGAAAASHRFVPKGLSTALMLMADSPIPVLVVKNNCEVNLSRKGLKLFVADDLSESCERAVLVGFDLATALGQTDLYHVYANAMTFEDFIRNLKKLREINKVDSKADFGSTELWEETTRILYEKLKLRAPGRNQFLETAGGHYWPEIRDGDIETSLEKSIDTAAPDILVFGRLQSFHRRPFTIGQVPFHFMLSTDRALLIVPSE
jgi:nucleotide-binding universal stress UspA family protein